MSSQLGSVQRVPHPPFLQLFSAPTVMRSACIVEDMPQVFLFVDFLSGEIRRLLWVCNMEGSREGLHESNPPRKHGAMVASMVSSSQFNTVGKQCVEA